tara:strand:+ start:1051 stop:1206 length:156 start_codon:yes stop_codon:yes gene_type:complete
LNDGCKAGFDMNRQAIQQPLWVLQVMLQATKAIMTKGQGNGLVAIAIFVKL